MGAKTEGAEHTANNMDNLAAVSFGYCRSVPYSVAGMHHDLVALIQSGENFRHPIVAVTDLDHAGARTSVEDGKNSPIIALPEQCAQRHAQNVIGIPHRDVHDDSVIMPSLS